MSGLCQVPANSAEAKRLASDRFLFDGKRETERSLTALVREGREPFAQSTGTGEYVDYRNWPGASHLMPFNLVLIAFCPLAEWLDFRFAQVREHPGRTGTCLSCGRNDAAPLPGNSHQLSRVTANSNNCSVVTSPGQRDSANQR